jgi:hypothetical protein
VALNVLKNQAILDEKGYSINRRSPAATPIDGSGPIVADIANHQ